MTDDWNSELVGRLQEMAVSTTEGRLLVHSYLGEGEIFLCYGKVLHARFGQKSGWQALETMLKLSEIRFTEDDQSCGVAPTIDKRVDEIMAMLVAATVAGENKIDWKEKTARISLDESGEGHPSINLHDCYIELVVEGGPLDGNKTILHRGENLIGKVPGCTLELADDMVSRRHCLIVINDAVARVIDLGSTNGVKLNGHLVRDANLYPDDVLELGGVRLRVSFHINRHASKVGGFPKRKTVAIDWKEFTGRKTGIFSKFTQMIQL